MSVLMTLHAHGDPQKLEEFATQNPDGMRSIAIKEAEVLEAS
jgi:hypothetical protein